MQLNQLLSLWIITTSVFMAILFIRALSHKVTDLDRFVGFVDNYRLVPHSMRTITTYSLIVCEALVSVFLLIPSFVKVGAALAISMLLLYAFAIALNVTQGRVEIECGCGGSPMNLSYGLVLRNFGLALLAAPLVFLMPNPLSLIEFVVAAFCGVVLYALYAIGEQLMVNFKKAQLTKVFR